MDRTIEDMTKDSIKTARGNFNCFLVCANSPSELATNVIEQLKIYWGAFTTHFTFYEAISLLETAKHDELEKLLKTSINAGKVFAQFYLFNWCIVGSSNLLA